MEYVTICCTKTGKHRNFWSKTNEILKDGIILKQTFYSQTGKMLSYGFHITFMLALFHDKKCCNYINLFPCILWDSIVMGLVLSW